MPLINRTVGDVTPRRWTRHRRSATLRRIRDPLATPAPIRRGVRRHRERKGNALSGRVVSLRRGRSALGGTQSAPTLVPVSTPSEEVRRIRSAPLGARRAADTSRRRMQGISAGHGRRLTAALSTTTASRADMLDGSARRCCGTAGRRLAARMPR